jgi:hypothetical protein
MPRRSICSITNEKIILKWTVEKERAKGGLNSNCLGQDLIVGFVNTAMKL